MNLHDVRIAILGLGYVGLPLAVEFAKHFPVVGFDINERRVDELNRGHDRTLEVPDDELRGLTRFSATADPEALRESNVYIITAPTPVNEHKQPDLGPVLAATRTVAGALKPGDTVVYESTVYPGATEEDCVPVLEEVSNLKLNEDFWVGYSPERINPGDKEHRLPSILKITSGSTPEAATFIDDLYGTIISAGTHKAPSIRVAEAAKVIENTQRDVNIALINELAILFNKLGIDTHDVLDAAGTKWNFQRFQPGLVGGHCIGVDPYYLTHKAQAVGYHPEIILAGRRLNDSMTQHVAARVIKRMTRDGLPVLGGRALVLGLTFKPDTPDLRNTKVIDLVNELASFGLDVDVHDPLADKTEANAHLGISLTSDPQKGGYSVVILAVPHAAYRDLGASVRDFLSAPDGLVFDLHSALPRASVDMRL